MGYIKFLGSCLLLVVSTSAVSQIIVGNGGDLIECRSSGGNNFDGVYMLDYIATYDSIQGDDAYLDASDHARTIATLVTERFPALGNHLTEFLDSAEAQIGIGTDYESPFLWMNASNGLRTIHDEQLSFLPQSFPENCLNETPSDGHRISMTLLQVVEHRMRGEVRVFNYDNRYYQMIRRDSLQRSFLLIHEWLWQFSPSADVTRDVNRFLHTNGLVDSSPQSFKRILTNLGLDLDRIPPSTITIRLDNLDGYETQTVYMDEDTGVKIRIDNVVNGFFSMIVMGEGPGFQFVWMRPDHMGGPTTVEHIVTEPKRYNIKICDPGTQTCGNEMGLLDIRYR